MTRRITQLILAFALALPATAHAHQQLLSAAPAEGASLRRVPREVRLTFNQSVDPSLARITLVGPAGEVPLGALTVPRDSARVMRVSITGELQQGTYTVHWLVTGDDGHPVRGRYSFEVAAGAEGIVSPPIGTPVEPGRAGREGGAPPPEQRTVAEETGFGSGSPLYAAVRFLNFTGLLALIGAVSFTLLLLPSVRLRDASVPAGSLALARSRAGAVGLAAGGILLVALVLRFYAQSVALHGPGAGLVGELTGAMLSRTAWGWGWLLQAGATLMAIIGLSLARTGRSAGWSVAAVATLALGFTPGLSGHAAGASALAVVADAMHVLAAGGWLGTLLILVLVGLPTALKDRGNPAAVAMMSAFSPLALSFAAIVTLTGAAAAWTHLPEVSALWTSAYGRTLLLKLAVLSVVFATGSYNWRRALPALRRGGEARPLKRSASVELLMGSIVLAITAVLVATPPPEDVSLDPQAPVSVER